MRMTEGRAIWIAAWAVLTGWRWNAVGADAGASSAPDKTYASLTLSNLPPLSAALERAAARHAAEAPEIPDWTRRMQQATLVPRLEVRYGMGETRFRDYAVVNRREVTSGREAEHESETVRARETGTDASGAFSGSSSSSSRRDTRASRSYTTVTESGLDGFGIGEHPRWMNAWEVSLLWDFSQLIFRPEEVEILRAKVDAARVQMDRATFEADLRGRVITAYYELVEALRLLELETYRNSVPAWIRKERAAAVLDDLTGGLLRGIPAAGAAR